MGNEKTIAVIILDKRQQVQAKSSDINSFTLNGKVFIKMKKGTIIAEAKTDSIPCYCCDSSEIIWIEPDTKVDVVKVEIRATLV
jgi:hypothetical protein